MALFFLRLAKLATVCGSPSLAKALFLFRVLAAVEHRGVLSRAFATVIDIGANRGQFALAARAASPSCKIIAFEPLDAPANTFLKLFRSDPRIRLVQAAIGETSASQLMHISARDDSSSLLPISALQEEIFPGTREASTVHVRVGPLDEFVQPTEIESPAMLKIDVQGFEYQVLAGCRNLLSLMDFVYCECSFVELYSGQALAHTIISWLSEHQFDLCGVFNASVDKRGQPIQADFLFRRRLDDAETLVVL